MSSFLLFLTRSPLYPGVLLVVVVIFSHYLLNRILQGYFFSFALPLAVLFFQPGNIVRGVVAFVLCFLERHILKKYWLRFGRLSIVFFLYKALAITFSSLFL